MSAPACPVCGGLDHEALGAKGGHPYLRCRTCRLVFAERLPTAAEMADSYGHYKSRRPTAWKLLRKAVKLLPLAALARARRRHDRALRFLDVGCNTGYSTEAARWLGFEAHGLELNSHTREAARAAFPRCEFHGVPVEQLAATGARYDVVHCCEVVEHVPDPHAFVAALAALTEPGGTLFITTPDTGHWHTPRDLLRWVHLIPVQHIRMFERVTLERLLREHGFRLDFQVPQFKSDLRFYCRRVA